MSLLVNVCRNRFRTQPEDRAAQTSAESSGGHLQPSLTCALVNEMGVLPQCSPSCFPRSWFGSFCPKKELNTVEAQREAGKRVTLSFGP